MRAEWILSVRFLCVYLCSAFKRLSIFLLNVLLLKLKFLICGLFPIERNKSGSGAFHRWSESFAFRTNVFGLLLSSSVLYIFRSTWMISQCNEKSLNESRKIRCVNLHWKFWKWPFLTEPFSFLAYEVTWNFYGLRVRYTDIRHNTHIGFTSRKRIVSDINKTFPKEQN